MKYIMNIMEFLGLPQENEETAWKEFKGILLGSFAMFTSIFFLAVLLSILTLIL